MKILHVISSGGMYGAEAVILNLSRTLNEMDAATHTSSLAVFTSEAQPNRELYAAALREGVDAYPIPCRGQLDLSVPAAIRNLAHRLQADILHAHGYKADLYSWLAARPASLPLVSTCHTWYDNDLALRLYGALDRWLLRKFDLVVGVSGEVHSRLRQAGVRAERIRTIVNGIDLRPFAGTLPRAASSPLHVGMVARLAPEKGCDLFLRAAAQVLLEFPGAIFHIAGDGPERAALTALIQELRIEENVVLAGRQEDIPAFYASLDLLVSASRQEGLPIALLEGMAAALPLVATRAGEVSALVLDGITGTLVPIEDVPALTAGMATLLRDRSLRQRFGAAARLRVATTYSAEQMTAAYLAAYLAVLDARGTRQPGSSR